MLGRSLDISDKKKEWNTDTWYNMDDPQKYNTKKKKKLDTKGHLLYDSVCALCLKQEKL